MASVVLGISLAALLIALGEYILYNLIIMLAGLLRPPRLDGDSLPNVSVIVPAHNEEKHIRRKLENLLESDYPPDLLEVIVIDDGSTDGTAEIVREFEDEGVTLLQTGERRGKIFAQKEALNHASADIIAITDATVVIPPDGIRRLVAHMATPRVGAVSASMSVRNRDTNYLTRLSQFLFDIQNAQKLGESRLDSAAGLFGQFSLIRRDAVVDFSTDAIYEDREFGISLRKRGYRARLEPGVVAEYYAPESLADFSRQKQRNIGAMTQSLVRHRGMLFNPAYGFYGLVIFPEYSLFRQLRAYLLILAFVGVALYSAVLNPAAFPALLVSMAVATVGAYVLGTALLAPMVAEPAKFLLAIFTSIPGMIVVFAQLAVGSIRYFRGDFSAKWDRVTRDRTI